MRSGGSIQSALQQIAPHRDTTRPQSRVQLQVPVDLRKRIDGTFIDCSGRAKVIRNRPINMGSGFGVPSDWGGKTTLLISPKIEWALKGRKLLLSNAPNAAWQDGTAEVIASCCTSCAQAHNARQRRVRAGKHPMAELQQRLRAKVNSHTRSP